ncbi:MAG TPA: hypothetical protein DGH68_12890 [Bacteroidetes bacterium]|nr:hypothetical protein [Bacteroidota bacterium]
MKSKLNAEWHRANRMPKNATLEQRIAWHLQHEKHCACRPMPDRLRRELKRHRKGGSLSA